MGAYSGYSTGEAVWSLPWDFAQFPACVLHRVAREGGSTANANQTTVCSPRPECLLSMFPIGPSQDADNGDGRLPFGVSGLVREPAPRECSGFSGQRLDVTGIHPVCQGGRPYSFQGRDLPAGAPGLGNCLALWRVVDRGSDP